MGQSLAKATEAYRSTPAARLHETSSRLDDLASVLQDVKDALVDIAEDEPQRKTKKIVTELVKKVDVAVSAAEVASSDTRDCIGKVGGVGVNYAIQRLETAKKKKEGHASPMAL